MTPTTAAEARALVEEYLETKDASVFADAIADMKTHHDEGNFAIMLGSGNEVSTFVKALYLFEKAKLMTSAESIAYIRRT